MKLVCPKCGHRSERTAEWVMKTAFYRCEKCSVAIEQRPETMELAKALAEVEEALARVFGPVLKK